MERRMTTWRHVRWAPSTSRLKPSDSASPPRPPDRAPSKRSRRPSWDSAIPRWWRPDAQPEVVDPRGPSTRVTRRAARRRPRPHVGEQIGSTPVSDNASARKSLKRRTSGSRRTAGRAPHSYPDRCSGGQGGRGRRHPGWWWFLVCRGEAPREGVDQAVALDLTQSLAQRVTEAITPGAAHRDEPLLEAVLTAAVRWRTRSPSGIRTTNWSRESADSETRAVNSTLSPPKVSQSRSAMRVRTEVL